MFNIMLDEYPSEWKGKKIDTDFRIGIQMNMIADDDELSDFEKVYASCNLLFEGDVPEDTKDMEEALTWFLNGWNHDHFSKGKGQSDKCIDFDQDQGRIYSAFLSQYHIDLNNADMHWWKFMYLLSNLEECSFTRVIDIRTKKLTGKMMKEEREMYMKNKKIYSISKPKELSEEQKEAEQEAVEQFLKNIGR